jgi:hypothetical protein
MDDDDLLRLGEYATSDAGSSTRVVAASEFCEFNDIDIGDELTAYLHAGTGALVLVPGGGEVADE